MMAWRQVTAVMAAAGIPPGPHHTPKGLRHGFGIHAISSGVPLNMLCKWMGHASMEVTAIYANALGVITHPLIEVKSSVKSGAWRKVGSKPVQWVFGIRSVTF